MILAVDASSVTAAAALCSGDGTVVRSETPRDRASIHMKTMPIAPR